MLRHDLPQDLVVEILSSLPVKSLMRFNCVHKSWYALIRSPHFITKHHKCATSNNLGRGVVLKYETEGGWPRVSLLSNDTLEVSRDVDLLSLFPHKIFSLQCIYGPCNGIFFLQASYWYDNAGDLVLWNPATRESKLLPRRPYDSGGDIVSFHFGFGIDPNTNDYKVVRILDFLCLQQPLLEVYNLSTDSWRAIDRSVSQSYCFVSGKFPSYLNGFYHWMAIEWNKTRSGCQTSPDLSHFPLRRLLVSFDMSNEVFQETPLPTEIQLSDLTSGDIAVINDSVSLIVKYFDMKNLDIDWFDLWVMSSEIGVERTWTKKLKVEVSFFERLLEIREDGLVLLHKNDEECLTLYDCKTQERRKFAKCGECNDESFAASYTETLASMNGGGNISI